jgi:GrpB-like predicted nucleotidyltransferase (UPF0157 family)
MERMPVHPLWRPFEQPDTEQIRAARVDPDDTARWTRAVEVAAADPSWPARFDEVAAAIRAALGDRALAVEHVGSTSVPGLAAKPVIDVDLTVADAADEASYLRPLEAAGFVLVIREPEWEEHRALTWDVIRTNLHVFPAGSVEPQRHIAFRDWLRSHPDDLRAYAELKSRLAERGFTDVMLYNNAKAALIYDIYERIFAADPQHPHDPQPRPG